MSEYAVELDEVQEAPRERFTVDNDMKAEWCLSKIRSVRKAQEKEKAELQRQMDFYVQQMEMIDRKAEEDIQFFEGMLREYFKSRIDDGFTKATKTKVSYKLPTGELVMKHMEPEYKRDEAVLIDWLKANDGKAFVKTKESLDWAGLKKTLKVVKGTVVDANGEVPPGIEVCEREDEFVVEVK